MAWVPSKDVDCHSSQALSLIERTCCASLAPPRRLCKTVREMLDIPSRARLAALTDAINAVIGSVAVGFAKRVDEDQVAVLYCYQYGIAKYIFSAASVPESLRPSSFDSSRFEVA